jgi:hypothetical protein
MLSNAPTGREADTECESKAVEFIRTELAKAAHAPRPIFLIHQRAAHGAIIDC